jgi:hypothetical protein
MSFEIQFTISAVLVVLGWLFLTFKVVAPYLERDSSTMKNPMTCCDYCSNVGTTTLYDDNIEVEVVVCERHLKEILD